MGAPLDVVVTRTNALSMVNGRSQYESMTVSTKQKDIDAAVVASNTAGKAFNGNTMGFKD